MPPVELLQVGGATYELKLSNKPSENNGGYVGVVKQHNLFHAQPIVRPPASPFDPATLARVAQLKNGPCVGVGSVL